MTEAPCPVYCLNNS